jgi:hypothetical protein
MCSCSPAVMESRPSLLRLSLHDLSALEAQQFKWIASEQAGRDLGPLAIRKWVHEHWNGFLRARWLEHLHGRTFWIELKHDDFGLLEREFHGSPYIDVILDRVKDGQENLDIICWAIEGNLPMWEVDDILEILEALDINSRRIECEVEKRLSRGN